MTQSQMMIHPQRQIMKRPYRKRKKTAATISATTPETTPTATTTTALPCLPHDIIFFHILSKLPVKCLLRSNCVSKLWYNTIHDPNFHASQLTHAKSNSSLVAMLYQEALNLHFLHLLERDGQHHHHHHHLNPNTNDKTIATLELQASSYLVVGTCNGLVCSITPNAIQISNPSTRELLNISFPKTPDLKRFVVPHKALGFDPLKNEYKVIYFEIHDSKDYECWLYILGTDKWRNITTTCNFQPHCYPAQLAICINGTIFWRTNWNRKILTFDLLHEKFQVITCPQVPPGSKHHDLFELEGCPCLVYRRDENLEVQFTLCTLKNYPYQLWHTKQQQHPSSSCSSSRVWCIKTYYTFNPAIKQIRFAEVAKHIYMQWSTMDKHFVLCDLTRKRLIHNKLYSFTENKLVVLVNHVESLLSLKTFVPPSAGEVKVKYWSSREGIHQCLDHQNGETQRKRHRKKFDSNGYIISPCWFSNIM